jgi:hypothetical protein
MVATFHEQFAAIVAEGLPYLVFDNGEENWMIRCYDEDGSTARMIQYKIEEDGLRIFSLWVGDEPEGNGHILRIAAESADLFKSKGFKKIKGKDFTTTPAGQAFKGEAEKIKGYAEDDFTVLDIKDFEKLKQIKADKDKGKA